MSTNFSWFLRVILYIPLTLCAILLAFYLYLTSSFDNNLDACMQLMDVKPSINDRTKMVPFVGCLKKRSNFFMTRVMDEDRLYQYAYPKLPCYFIGKWHVSSGYREYWLTIDKDAKFSEEKIQYGKGSEQNHLTLRTGIWSSADRQTAIQFYDDMFFWPIHEGEVTWRDDKHFVMAGPEDDPSYFYRHTELEPGCKFSAR